MNMKKILFLVVVPVFMAVVEGGGKVRLVAEENYDTWSIDI